MPSSSTTLIGLDLVSVQQKGAHARGEPWQTTLIMDGHSEPPPFLSWAAEVVTQCFHGNSWDTFPAAACIRERVPSAISFSKSPGGSRFSLVLASSITLSCLNSTWMWNAGTVLKGTFERSGSNFQRKQQVHLKSWKGEFKTDDSQDNFQLKVWIKTGYFQKVNESSSLRPYPSTLASANNLLKPSHTTCFEFSTDAAVFAKAVWPGRLSLTHGNASGKLMTSREATPHCPKCRTPDERCAEGWGEQLTAAGTGQRVWQQNHNGPWNTEGAWGRAWLATRASQGKAWPCPRCWQRAAGLRPRAALTAATWGNRLCPPRHGMETGGEGKPRPLGWMTTSWRHTLPHRPEPARQRRGWNLETRRAEGSTAASPPQPLPAPPPAPARQPPPSLTCLRPRRRRRPPRPPGDDVAAVPLLTWRPPGCYGTASPPGSASQPRSVGGRKARGRAAQERRQAGRRDGRGLPQETAVRERCRVCATAGGSECGVNSPRRPRAFSSFGAKNAQAKLESHRNL